MKYEVHEIWGAKVRVPCEEVVGRCEACGGDIYESEEVECDCGRTVHRGCIVQCRACYHMGCKGCMFFDQDSAGFYFCGKLDDSVCFELYTRGD